MTATRTNPDGTLPRLHVHPRQGPDVVPAHGAGSRHGSRHGSQDGRGSQDGLGVLPGKGVRAVSCPHCLRPLLAAGAAPDGRGGTGQSAPCGVCRTGQHEAMPAWLARWTRLLGR